MPQAVALRRPLAAVIVFLATAVPAGSQEQSQLVLAKKGTKEYHWPHCPVVRDGKGVLALTRGKANAQGLTPHSGCDPSNPESVKPGDPEPDASKGEPEAAKGNQPKPPPPMFVEKDGRHYHLATCKDLGKERTKLTLDEAGRKYWPCPTCKPPIRPRPRPRRSF